MVHSINTTFCQGAMGSNFFVDHYLIPEELKRARAKFQGAFILDGILNYNDIPNTQELPMDYAQVYILKFSLKCMSSCSSYHIFLITITMQKCNSVY